MAKDAGFTVLLFSHRLVKQKDATIADLAVGTAAGQIKGLAPTMPLLIVFAKYKNQLLRIEEQLGVKRL